MLPILITLILSPVMAAQTSCEDARKARLPGRDLLALTERVCGPFTWDPDAPQDQAPIPASQKLVFEYTDNCHQRMNTELRKASGADAFVIEAAKQLDSVLCDYPTYQGPTFRGAQLPKEVLDRYLKSKSILMESFTSASTSKWIGCKFSGNTIFVIQSKTGRAISQHSKHADEEEVLFRIGTEFKVVNVSRSTDEMMKKARCFTPLYMIELEEI